MGDTTLSTVWVVEASDRLVAGILGSPGSWGGSSSTWRGFGSSPLPKTISQVTAEHAEAFKRGLLKTTKTFESKLPKPMHRMVMYFGLSLGLSLALSIQDTVTCDSFLLGFFPAS